MKMDIFRAILLLAGVSAIAIGGCAYNFEGSLSSPERKFIDVNGPPDYVEEFSGSVSRVFKWRDWPQDEWKVNSRGFLYVNRGMDMCAWFNYGSFDQTAELGEHERQMIEEVETRCNKGGEEVSNIDWINSDRATFEKHLKTLEPKPGWIGHIDHKVTLTPRAPRDKVTDVELFEVHENGTVTLRHHSVLYTVKVDEAIPDERHPASIFLDSADYDKQTATILYFTAVYREGP